MELDTTNNYIFLGGISNDNTLVTTSGSSIPFVVAFNSVQNIMWSIQFEYLPNLDVENIILKAGGGSILIAFSISAGDLNLSYVSSSSGTIL